MKILLFVLHFFEYLYLKGGNPCSITNYSIVKIAMMEMNKMWKEIAKIG